MNWDRIFKDVLVAAAKAQKVAVLNEKDLRDLIDLTLVLGDEDWFMELSNKLNLVTS